LKGIAFSNPVMPTTFAIFNNLPWTAEARGGGNGVPARLSDPGRK